MSTKENFLYLEFSQRKKSYNYCKPFYFLYNMYLLTLFKKCFLMGQITNVTKLFQAFSTFYSQINKNASSL